MPNDFNDATAFTVEESDIADVDTQTTPDIDVIEETDIPEQSSAEEVEEQEVEEIEDDSIQNETLKKLQETNEEDEVAEEEAVEVEATEAEEVTAEPPETEESTTDAETVLNWEDDKVPFRKEYKKLKNEVKELKEDSLSHLLLTDVDEFHTKIKEESPTQYSAFGEKVIQESVASHPEQWAKYVVENKPDLVAKALTGVDTMTADFLKEEIALVDESELENITPQSAETKKLQDEVKELKSFKTEVEQQKTTQLRNEVLEPINQSVDALFADAGLEVAETDTPEDKAYKETIGSMMPMYIDLQIQADPKLLHLQSQIENFIEKGDKVSANRLTHVAQVSIENHASKFLEIMTNQRAKQETSKTVTPKKKPKTPIKTASNNQKQSEFTNSVDDWKVTAADLISG